MKILRIIYDWPPPWIGLVPHPYEITRAQVNQGHQVDVFCARWPFAGPLEIPDGVGVRSFWREPIKYTWMFTTSLLMFMYYMVWRTIATPDVIHMHGHFGVWILAYRKFLSGFFKNSEELKIPLVYHFHNTAKGRWEKAKSENKSISLLAEKLSWPMEVWANKLGVELSDAYIFVSDQLKQEAAQHYGVEDAKCTVVESGVNPELFRPIGPDEKDKTRADLGLISTDKVVLNYGFIVERKNPHLLIEALRFLPISYKLMLVGSSEPAYEERLNEIIKANKLNDRVVRVGYTPYPDVPIAIQASDIFVLPSSYEGMPKVVFESLACSVPVLASGFTAQEDLSGLSYLTSLDPESIANQIRSIVEYGTFVDVNKIRALYSWSRKVEQIQQVYDSIKK